MPPGKALVSRPSVLIRTVQKKELDLELELEANTISKNSALRNALSGFDEVQNFLKDGKNKKQECFEKLNKLLHNKVVDMFSKHSKDEERAVMANRLARIGFVESAVDYYNFVMDELDIEAVEESFVEEAQRFEEEPPSEPHIKYAYHIVLGVREILWNYSDSSNRFSALVAETSMLKILVRDLGFIFTDELEEMNSEETGENLFAFCSAVAILYNCAQNVEVDRQVFRNVDTVHVLSQFLQSKSTYIKMVTFLALANMVNENEVKKFAAGTDVISFLTDAITKALKAPDRKEHGFHLTELVEGLALMAKSDENKQSIMKQNGLTLVNTILEGPKVSESETLASVKLLWELSFSGAAKQDIKQRRDLMSKLEKLKDSKNHDIKSAAKHVYFLLVDKDARLGTDPGSRANKKGVASIPGSPSADNQVAGKHIMISYCWGNKEMVLKIYHDLREAGFPLWIDVADMGAYQDVLDGMAKAVENAFVVLMCYSEKYKQSQNCRTEADYLFAKKKNFIGLKMQRDYIPDGWLGILLGSKLYVEFTDKYPYDNKLKELTSRLQDLMKDGGASNSMRTYNQKAVVSGGGAPSIPQPIREVPDFSAWTNKDVLNWLKDNKLDGVGKVKQQLLTGEHVSFLIDIMRRCPETYYHWLETKLNLKSLDETMKFDKALQTLAK